MKHLLIAFFICVFAFLQLHNAMAQVPFFRKIVVQGISDGFEINSMCQDSSLVMWLGTNEGIFRYDGLTFSRVQLPDSFTDLNVTAIASYGDDAIIAGTRKGSIYKKESGKWLRIVIPSLNTETSISAIGIGDSNSFWIGTKGAGLFEMRGNKVYRYSTENGLVDDYIYTVCEVKGKMWVGTDRGISCLQKEHGKLLISNLNTENGLPDNIVRSIIKGPGSTIGIGMEEHGFCMYDYNTTRFSYQKYFKSWSKGPVSSVILLENEFWIGTGKHGIVDYEFQAGRRIREFSKADGFTGTDINCMITDHEGNVWVGAGNELYLSPGEKIEYKRSLDKLQLGNVRSLLVDKNDNIWISNKSGVFYFNRNYTDKPLIIFPFRETKAAGYTIISFFEDHFGYIWMGTFDQGVIRFDLKTGKYLMFNESDGLINPSVLSIDGDLKNIWFATLGGVSRCSVTDSTLSGIGSFTGFSEEDGLGNNFIYKVFISSKGEVWFGTDGKGITRFKNGRFTNFDASTGLTSKVIYSITEDRTGKIWISSVRDGIFVFDGNRFKNISILEGLSDAGITSLFADAGHNIISVNRKGIDLIDSDNYKVVSFSDEVGLVDIDADINVFDIDSKGNSWIGVKDGIVKLSFKEMSGSVEPDVIIQRVLSFLLPVDTNAKIIFAHNNNHISFDYFAIWYSNPDRVSYQYKLEGYNHDWITTKDRSVIFPNLSPGKYSFSVTASHNGSFNYSKIAKIDFTIEKPIWQRAWFLALMLIIAGFGVNIYLRYRDAGIKRMEKLNRERVESQFEVLKNQVNPHFLFNSFNTLISVIEKDKDIAVEYVNKLSDFFRSILTFRETDLITLSEELKLVDDYIFLQQKRYGKNFEVDFNVDLNKYYNSLIPPLTIQTLLENALKHNSVSVETPLVCKVYTEDDRFIVVENNINARLSHEASTGIGIPNLKNRYKILTGSDISVIKSDESFKVKLPLIKAD